MIALVILLVMVRVHDSIAEVLIPMKADYRDHPCIRTCQVNYPMVCEYAFRAEYFYTLTKACWNCPHNVSDCYRPGCVPADGNSRAILVINRMLPGPGIHVCEGDTVIVNLHNKMTGEGMSIHWHGILQHDSPHMDGVGMLTQCPIPAYTTFQYRFKVSDPGTHFWHGHFGLHRADGIFGAFVVRQAAEHELQHGLYDYDLPEHTILINDWLLELTLNRFANHHQAYGDNKPGSMLINGKGAHRVFYDNERTINITTPYEVFNVERGRRYRFRIISNGILNCPVQFSIDNHTLRVISSDGNPFQYIDVESINLFAGERYDVVVLADQDMDNYWVRARGQGDCSVKNAFQQAILRYNGSAEELPNRPSGYLFGARAGKKLNPWNRKATDMLVPVTHLENLRPSNKALNDIPDKKFYLAMDFNNIENFNFYVGPEYVPPLTVGKAHTHLLTPQINHISNTLPPSPPLSQFNDIPQDMFCNAATVQKNCSAEYCECIHTIKVDLNDTVELVIIDEGKVWDANHPMHLHGHKFRVIGMDRLNKSTTLEEVKKLDNEGKLMRNLTSPVDKDTVTVPDGGYVILRIHADNPGFWFMHCHLEFHADVGMGFVLQVGGLDQIPSTPANFPRCGNWPHIIAPPADKSVEKKFTT
ncbi:laccase-1-like isoform X1 [Mizuhopecten yessoensis]|uniref:laccase-1-like isoform X1 n=1 Tax=Mizuhopecten yessoensis TaxID=6573 RepID=UPI000B45CA34|nr:laccase-1-like isoform X1 [Mizuhopecten yessoensis]